MRCLLIMQHQHLTDPAKDGHTVTHELKEGLFSFSCVVRPSTGFSGNHLGHSVQ